MGRVRAQRVYASFPEEVHPRLSSVAVAARLGEEVRSDGAVQMAVLVGTVKTAAGTVAGGVVARRTHARWAWEWRLALRW